jgi:hypothetical protein
VYTRTAAAGDPASWTFTLGAPGKAIGVIAAYSGAAASAWIDDSEPKINPSSSSHVAASVTTTNVNRTLVTITGLATATAMTRDPAMTERVNTPSSAGGPTVSMAIADQAVTAVGATGTRTLASAVAAPSAVLSVVLAPTVTGGSPATTSAYEYGYGTTTGCAVNEAGRTRTGHRCGSTP